MTQKFYLKDVTATDPPSAGEKSVNNTPTQADNATGAEETRSLESAIGTAQTSIAQTTDATTASRKGYHARFTSKPLQAGTYGSGDWTLALGVSESNAQSNANVLSTATGIGALYFWRPSTQEVVGFVSDGSGAVVDEWPTAERGEVDTFTGANVTIQDGDVLVLEVWRLQIQGMAASYTNTIFFGGTVEPVDGIAISDAASYLNAPADIPELATVVEKTWLDTFLGTDTWSLTRAKTFVDTFLGTDVWNVAKEKQFLDTLLGTDVWTVEKFVAKLFADTFSGADTWTLERFKQWLDTLTGSDSWVAEKAKQFLDSFAGTDSWLLERGKKFADVFLGTDLWTQEAEVPPPQPPVHQMNMSDSKTVLRRRPVGFYEEVTYKAEFQDILPIAVQSGEINLSELFQIIKTTQIDQESKFKVRQVKLLDHKLPTSFAITSSMESIQKIPIAKTLDLEQLDFVQIAAPYTIDLVDKINVISAKKLVDIVNVVKAVKSIPVGAAGLVPRTKTRFERTKTSTEVRKAEGQVSNKLTSILNNMKNRIRENNATLLDLQNEFASEVKTAITIGVRDSYLAGVKYVEKATRIVLVPTPAQTAEINSVSEERENQFWRQVQELINQEQKEELERTNVISMMPVIATTIASLSLALGTKSSLKQANELSLEISVKTSIIEPDFGVPPKKMRLIWMTEKDFRVCPICRRLDGQIFFAEDQDVPQPVTNTHENCRCRLMIYDEIENKVFNG